MTRNTPTSRSLHYNYGAAAVKRWGHGTRSHLEILNRSTMHAASRRPHAQIHDGPHPNSANRRGGFEGVPHETRRWAPDADEVVVFWSQTPAALARRKQESRKQKTTNTRGSGWNGGENNQSIMLPSSSRESQCARPRSRARSTFSTRTSNTTVNTNSWNFPNNSLHCRPKGTTISGKSQVDPPPPREPSSSSPWCRRSHSHDRTPKSLSEAQGVMLCLCSTPSPLPLTAPSRTRAEPNIANELEGEVEDKDDERGPAYDTGHGPVQISIPSPLPPCFAITLVHKVGRSVLLLSHTTPAPPPLASDNTPNRSSSIPHRYFHFPLRAPLTMFALRKAHRRKSECEYEKCPVLHGPRVAHYARIPPKEKRHERVKSVRWIRPAP
ncbi:hypothetical protein B0H16DRAFT_1695658 [Mycena metata]|uniref:Uncharacterized protein n=1 Tax=Mycena metata TaxID=1033252 RepID=A0AAD7I6H5_9AGAR|nr:hypothetical protein B0H16DRAFT_1695658 [Mycena metata]